MSTNSAVKHDKGKPRMELLPPSAIEEIAKVFTFGANKYSANGWRDGFLYTRLIGALLRHVYSFTKGEDNDEESGLSHLAHAGCCILMLLAHVLEGLGSDDRYSK